MMGVTGHYMDALFSFSFHMIDRVMNWRIMTVAFRSFSWQGPFKYNYEYNMNLSKNLQFLSPVEEATRQP